MQLDDLPGNREAETGARIVGIGMVPVELFDDRFQRVRRNTRPGVPDLQLRPCADLVHRHGDRAGPRRVAYRVGQEVFDDPLDQRDVGLDRGHVPAALRMDPDLFAARVDLVFLDHILGQFRHGESLTPKLQIIGIEFGQFAVAKLDAAAANLSIGWDTVSCPGTRGHQIVYGWGSELPIAPGGSFGIGGSRCDVGITSPFTWRTTPDPLADASGLLWWLMIARDGAVTEGSWGADGNGVERQGPAAGGSSGECGIATKDVGNTCGQ